MKWKVIGGYEWIALWKEFIVLQSKGYCVPAETVLVYKAIYSSGELWEVWTLYLPIVICIVLFFSVAAHTQLYSTWALTIHSWVSLFHKCPLMVLISFPYMLHAIDRAPDEIWDSKLNEFSSFSSIHSQQQIKTYATLHSWHTFVYAEEMHWNISNTDTELICTLEMLATPVRIEFVDRWQAAWRNFLQNCLYWSRNG